MAVPQPSRRRKGADKGANLLEVSIEFRQGNSHNAWIIEADFHFGKVLWMILEMLDHPIQRRKVGNVWPNKPEGAIIGLPVVDKLQRGTDLVRYDACVIVTKIPHEIRPPRITIEG